MISNKNVNTMIKKLKDFEIRKNSRWAIYGTGNGAERVYAALCSLSLNPAVKNVIERDEKVCPGTFFHGIPIKKLHEVCDSLDGIIIAAMDNHEIIKKRLCHSLTSSQLSRLCVIDIFAYNTKEDQLEYAAYIEESIQKKSKEFVDFHEQGYQALPGDTKVISWYLPQFHQIEMNNKFHGQGFTEWTNTSRAIPMFTGHYQPHIPYDVGYYDLMNPDTLKRQVYLAKHYGIYGFCFHYYWFSGKRLMEKPLDLLLEQKELDMPFCINWATENWTALWDGGSREVMIELELRPEDDEKFMESVMPYMKDPRYITMNGKPVFVIYRVNQFSKQCIRQLLDNFRKIAKQNGFPDLYIMLTNVFDFEDNVTDWGADALVEFPPHVIRGMMDRYEILGYLNPHFKGNIYDASSFIADKKYMLKHKSDTYFRSALTSWDNTARKATSGGAVFRGLNPQTFQTWLSDIIAESKLIHSESEDIVFVNSWNEWGEGSHLEPDMKYGYAYLQAVKDALENQRKAGT